MAWSMTNSAAILKGFSLMDQELASSSDRAVGIIAGSTVEAQLTDFLRRNVEDDGKIWESRTHSSAPLGSFAMKIDLAFMIGLVTKTAHSELVILKDVRNIFAHDLDVNDFGVQSIRDKCLNLKLVENYLMRPADEKATFSKNIVGAPFQIGDNKIVLEITLPKLRYVWTSKLFSWAFSIDGHPHPII